MKTKVTIELDIEAPDSTSMVSDITILLENIIYKIQDIAPNMADRYTSWQSDAKIIGSVDITPIHESKGAYKIELAQDKQAVDEHGNREYEVWLEGYSATGEHCPARFLGKYKATTFEVAVGLARNAHKLSPDLYDPIRMTHWGCRFFDNEADARKGYG